jgi:CelD/BcsL family acetyltransferase involved in cellulose biosynthesis
VVRVLKRVEQVGEAWQRLEEAGAESAGHSRAVIRQWIAATGVPVADQFFVLAEIAGDPLALLPLVRTRVGGVRILGWFGGPEFGPCGPLVDHSRLIELGARGRRALWNKMALALTGAADLIHLAEVPVMEEAGADLFAEFGMAVRTGLAFRAMFASWAEVAATQWTRERRNHDRRQGEQLAAAGTVGFRPVPGSDRRAGALVDVMLAHRRATPQARPDLWTRAEGAEFLRATVAPGSGVEVRLQVLSLGRELIAIRHNIVVGERMIPVVSSVAPNLQTPDLAPAEQCLLRVMHTAFDAGVSVLDFGVRASPDERRWCNQFVPVNDRYLALTALGRAAALGASAWQVVRAIAADPLFHRLGHAALSSAARLRHRNADPATAGAADASQPGADTR